MWVLGLTGGIACGKSNVSDALRQLGAVIIDGDVLSRELTCPNGRALPEIRRQFGGEVFHADGTLNRRALGAVIFSDAKRRAQLDGMMQPHSGRNGSGPSGRGRVRRAGYAAPI